jgi:hypothetical protein
MTLRKIFLIVAYVAVVLEVGVSHAAPHRIQVRQAANGGEFYDTVTNQTFVPRGNNYARLAQQVDPWTGQLVQGHSTFDPGLYDATAADSALAQWNYDGYNVVRVFLSANTIGNPNGGLSSAYLANVADFLTRAKAQGIYTQLVLNVLPKVGGYYVTNQNPQQIQSENWFYLSSEGVDAKARYVRDLITGLQGLGAPLDYVFSYNIENEQYFNKSTAPLSLTSGLVTTPTGTFDMSSAADRQQMMDSNLVSWINQVRASARAVDPTALVGPGFFAPRAVGSGDPRVTRTYWAIADASAGGSLADFVDLHSYPTGQTFTDDYNSFEVSSHTKPLILGEYGAFKSYYSTVTTAAYGMKGWQNAACQYGFKGYLLWTWDTVEQPELWNAIDSGGAINGQLAPIVRPDPCQ